MITKNKYEPIDCCAGIEKQSTVTLLSESGEAFEVTYTLAAINVPHELFVITAECGMERASVLIAEDRAKSEQIYSLVSEYGVMPSVLSETISDLEV